MSDLGSQEVVEKIYTERIQSGLDELYEADTEDEQIAAYGKTLPLVVKLILEASKNADLEAPERPSH